MLGRKVHAGEHIGLGFIQVGAWAAWGAIGLQSCTSERGRPVPSCCAGGRASEIAWNELERETRARFSLGFAFRGTSNDWKHWKDWKHERVAGLVGSESTTGRAP